MSTAGRYELRDSDHTDLFGIFLAVHAVPGAVMFLHTTVGCKFKTQLHLVYHDWFRESHNQRLWTGVDDERLIQGSGKRLLQFAESWYDRRKPELAVVTTNAAVDLSALDVEAAVEILRERLPCPVLLLQAPGYTGSLRGGYHRMLDAVSGLVDWEKEPDEKTVCLAGYLFDRFEMDHIANLKELRRLLMGIGLRTTASLFGGDPFDKIMQANEATSLVLLPYAHGIETDPSRFGGRKLALCDLPVGLSGSARFLRVAGKAAGIDPDPVDEFIEREKTKVVPLLAHAARVLEGIRTAVFLDTPMASAVTAFVLDLGAEVPLVCLTDGDAADAEAFNETLERLAPDGYRPPRVLPGPSRNESLREFTKMNEREPIPVAIGSSVQSQLLGKTRKQGRSRGRVRVLELGYPSTKKHCIYPVPWMGFNGAVGLAQRLMDAANSTH